MYIYIYLFNIYLYTYIFFFKNIYIYIYMHMTCVCVFVYVFVYHIFFVRSVIAEPKQHIIVERSYPLDHLTSQCKSPPFLKREYREFIEISGSNWWRYGLRTIFLALFCGDIPWNLGLKNRPKIYGIGTSNLGSWNGHWSSSHHLWVKTSGTHVPLPEDPEGNIHKVAS